MHLPPRSVEIRLLEQRSLHGEDSDPLLHPERRQFRTAASAMQRAAAQPMPHVMFSTARLDTLATIRSAQVGSHVHQIIAVQIIGSRIRFDVYRRRAVIMVRKSVTQFGPIALEHSSVSAKRTSSFASFLGEFRQAPSQRPSTASGWTRARSPLATMNARSSVNCERGSDLRRSQALIFWNQLVDGGQSRLPNLRFT